MVSNSRSAAVPLLLAPLVVVGPPSLGDRSATIESFLLSVRARETLVAVHALPNEIGLVALGFHGRWIGRTGYKPLR